MRPRKHEDTKKHPKFAPSRLRAFVVAFAGPRRIRLALLAAVAAALVPGTNLLSGQAGGTVTLYEGARLITGEPGPAIESSAFLVENDRFMRVGKRARSRYREARCGST